MDIKFYTGIIAGIISLVSYLIYFRSILKGETKPNRVTWWIWIFMGAVLTSSYYASGARDTIWSPLAEFLGPLVTAILAIKYDEGNMADKTDLVCFAGGIGSLVLWGITGDPALALALSLLIDFFAIVPTMKKSYVRPKGESFTAWTCTSLGDFLNLLSVETYTFVIILYPAWMLFTDLIIVGLLGRKQKPKRRVALA